MATEEKKETNITEEIKEAYDYVRLAKREDVCLFSCFHAYPVDTYRS